MVTLLKKKIRSASNVLVDLFFKSIFPACQKIGFHFTRNNYYQPIPDTRMLKEILWEKHSSLIGIDINEKEQLKYLELFSLRYKNEYDSFLAKYKGVPHEYILNSSFDSVDAEILYCMIRHFIPGKIIEVGSGYSTYLSAQAILKNNEEGNPCKLIAIEPYPNEIIRRGFPGLSELIPNKVEEIPLSQFESLAENDILFIDSSHVLKIGSDVQYEYLEILPRLKKGVIIHIHDIFMPAEYPKKWVLKDWRFFNEQYLLQALLMFNDTFKIIWAGSYMHIYHSDKLGKAFGSYNKVKKWPGSIWLKKIK